MVKIEWGRRGILWADQAADLVSHSA